jgi:hypothetical protein
MITEIAVESPYTGRSQVIDYNMYISNTHNLNHPLTIQDFHTITFQKIPGGPISIFRCGNIQLPHLNIEYELLSK